MLFDEREDIQLSESFSVAIVLAIAGGFLDAYTFICRGGVFANAQTGNIVLLGMGLAVQNYALVKSAISPIFAFMLGVFIAEFIKSKFKTPHDRPLHWRHGVLIIEIIILTIAAIIPIGEMNQIVNVMVSFVCSLQVQTFRTVHGNNFASTMCTGNLRSGTDALFKYMKTNKTEHIKKTACYYGIIICFIIGAIIGTIVSKRRPEFAVFIPVTIYIAAFILMVKWDKILDRG